MDNKLQDAINVAKMSLIMNPHFGFLSALFFSLDLEWNNSIPTACTDGDMIQINSEFFMNQTPDVRVSVLAHETWHVAFKHMTRCFAMGLNPKKYNIAADHVINNQIKDDGLAVPSSWLCDPKYKGMSAEQVYALLPDDPKSQDPDDGEGKGKGAPTGNDLAKPGSLSGQGKEKQPSVADMDAVLDNKILAAYKAAEMSGSGAGNVPGDVKTAIEDLLNPKLDWKTILQNYRNQFKQEDYAWSRPNLNYFHENLYLPGLHSEAVGEIACAVDTSCSVTDKQFLMFKSEIHDFISDLKPSLTTIIDFDTKIHEVHNLGPEDSIRDVSFTGRGGTDLRPVFKHYKDRVPEVLIVFSDLECRAIEKDPGYPVIWICIDNPSAQVNFGTLIHLDTRDL